MGELWVSLLMCNIYNLPPPGGRESGGVVGKPVGAVSDGPPVICVVGPPTVVDPGVGAGVTVPPVAAMEQNGGVTM